MLMPQGRLLLSMASTMYNPLGNLLWVLATTTFDIPARIQICCHLSPTITLPAYPPRVLVFL